METRVSDFQQALKVVLIHEGGNVDHPRDPGGRTSHGVTQRIYDGWRRKQGLPVRDVWKSTASERAAIYKAQYWDAVRGDELPAGVNYVLFDGAVNSGPVQSIKWLQRALGVQADGHLGESTMAAILTHSDHDRMIADICERRMAFLKALRTFSTFGRGWTRRVSEARQIGQAWASGSVGPVPTREIGREKSPITDAKKPRTVGPADGAVGAGVATSGAAQAINEAKASLEPLAGSSSMVAILIAVITIAGVVMALGGLVYRLWTKRQNAALEDALS
jgi:lysozyme family protein